MVNVIMEEEKPVFLTLKETAELLRLSLPTIYRMIRNKELRSAKVGKQRRLIYREDVMKYVKDRIE